MACKECLSGKFPEYYSYCPICGEHLRIAQTLREFNDAYAEFYKNVIRPLSNLVMDENGNFMELEREPIEVRHLGFDESILKPDDHDVDISKELEWLEKKEKEDAADE